MSTMEQQVEEMSGWVVFAAVLAIVAGALNVIQGLVYLFQDDLIFLTRDGFYALSFTTWGWILLILGIIQVAAGAGILSAKTWARVIGLAIAMLAFLAALSVFPVYPWWALFEMIILGLVIYALAVRWPETA